VLVGRDDILTPALLSRRLAALIPDAKLRILPGGHAFFIEEAPRFNRAILAFPDGVESILMEQILS
jgi:pimeloyl-ACP methyl ester carboxylesterase